MRLERSRRNGVQETAPGVNQKNRLRFDYLKELNNESEFNYF